jgi:hypothetical protein
MRLRCVCTLVALCAVLWSSGCCWWEHCCCRRHFHERECGCESSCYVPCNTCNTPPPLAPVMPPPTVISSNGSH